MAYIQRAITPILKKRISTTKCTLITGARQVGKSTLINKLTGRKSTQTGDKPGVTKSKQWVRLKGNLELLDTPGVLWPKFEDEEVALNLCFTGTIKENIKGFLPLHNKLDEWIKDTLKDMNEK